MKYIVFIFLFLPFGSNCQKVNFGVAGAYGTEIERSGINLGVGYFVRGNSSLDIGFTKFLDKERVVRNFDLHSTSWIIDLEFLQYFLTNEVVSIFVIAGVNWTNYTIEIYESGTFIGENNAASGPAPGPGQRRRRDGRVADQGDDTSALLVWPLLPHREPGGHGTRTQRRASQETREEGMALTVVLAGGPRNNG